MNARSAVTERDRWFVGTLLTLVATGSDTDGRMALMEQQARAGFSPPRHVHRREDTAMYVIDGELTIDIDGHQSDLGCGGFVWLPRDVPHTFRVDSDTARFLEIITPPGFEQYHVDASDPAPSLSLPPSTAPDIGRLVGAIAPYGAEIIGPPLTAR